MLKVPSYEGNEPFIFISYAHKDSAQVLKVLSYLRSRGLRIWYDDGIAPGSEWPEYIATHLDRAEAVISFITENSVNSPNCRREITFALSRNKPFVSVFLEQYLKDTQKISGLIGFAVSIVCLVVFGPNSFIIPTMAGILIFVTLLRKQLERAGGAAE